MDFFVDRIDKGSLPHLYYSKRYNWNRWFICLWKWRKIVEVPAIINKNQVDVYKKGKWNYKINDDKIMVLHTLTVNLVSSHRGIWKKFVDFYENYAKKNNCIELRIYTNEKNKIAREFHKKIGYSEIGIVPTIFNGIPDVNLVLFEKYLEN